MAEDVNLLDAFGLFDGETYNEPEFAAVIQYLMGTWGILRDIDSSFAPSVAAGDIRCASGQGFIKGRWCSSTTNKDHTPETAHASLNRLDRLVLRIDTEENEFYTVLRPGTPGAAGGPALTRTATIYETKIALVRVAASSGALTLTDEREFARGVGEPPVGSYQFGAWQFGKTTAPSGGYLLCAGQLVSTITYNHLFALIGHSYNGGASPGTDVFRLPDFRGRTPVGYNNMSPSGAGGVLFAPDAVGDAGGEQFHLLAGHEVGGHVHFLDGATGTDADNHGHAAPATFSGFVVGNPASTIGLNDLGGVGASTRGAEITAAVTQGYTQTHDHDLPSNTGIVNGTHNQPHNNMQPYRLCCVAIKV